MEPWMKPSSSTSAGSAARMALISENCSSLASTSRLAPREAQARAAAGLMILAWVDMCISMPGSISLTVASTPMSAMIMASRGHPRRSSRKRKSAGYSWVRGMVFRVRYSFFPIR